MYEYVYKYVDLVYKDGENVYELCIHTRFNTPTNVDIYSRKYLSKFDSFDESCPIENYSS